MSWLWILKLVWNRSSNHSFFPDFQSNIGLVVVKDLGNFDILSVLLLKTAELLLPANCWRANKIWSASIVAGVFSLRNCGRIVERALFCFRVKKSQGSNSEYLLKHLSPCERSHPGLTQLDCRHDRHRPPLQDGNQSGIDLRLVPGSLRRRSGMSASVGSREIRLTCTEYPRCQTLSSWTPR